jgi:acyl-CoA hydrolase/GNAT superfamily N-acetyltransferase
MKTKDTINWVSAAEAIGHIRRGKRILVGSGTAEPQMLVHALADQAHRFADNEIVHLLTMGVAPYQEPQYRNAFRHNAFFIGPNVRQAIARGDADYTPVFLSEIPALFKSGQLPIHAALIQVSEPNLNDGTVSLGVSVDIVLAAVRTAEMVIAQVNPNMPETQGQAKIPLEAITHFVRGEEPLIELPMGEVDPISAKIGENVASLIKDGATLQLGIGNIPNAVLQALSNKNDLGIHTEMFSDGVVSLYENGNITNKRKGLHDGVSVTSFVMGTKKLYDMVHRNPDFQFYPSEYTNDPFIISQNRNMISVNSAIEIDLTGQICADSMGGRFFSGIGGQIDFVRGARRSPGGRSIIALPSTAKSGSLSRIVPHLKEGAGVVTSRGDVQYVVTEFGIAYLHGMTVRERGLALVQIAHPKFRDELLDTLKERKYVYPDQRLGDTAPNDLIPEPQNFGERKIYFRGLNAADEKAMQNFFYSHTDDTIHHRYFHPVDSMPHESALHAVMINYDRDMAIAGFNGEEAYAKMACVARYIRHGEKPEATLAIVVGENHQNKGLGKFLLETLLVAARKHGIRHMQAFVRAENKRMIHLLKSQGFSRQDWQGDLELYACDL